MKQPELGLRMRELRNIAGLTLDELATRSNVNKATISQIENGKANPSVALLEKLANEIQAEIVISVMGE